MRQILEQVIDGAANGVVDDPEIETEQKHGNDDHDGGGLDVLVGRRGHLLHLRANIVIESLDSLWPGLDLTADAFVAHYCRHRFRHLLQPFTAGVSLPFIASKLLAGAEGFEPPSPVLETGSLAVELTPLFFN